MGRFPDESRVFDRGELFEAARRALEDELSTPIRGLDIVSESARQYSTCWELRPREFPAHRTYILKLTPGRAQRELELTRVAQELADSSESFQAPAVACCPTESALLVERLPGLPLAELLSQPPWFGFAEWLARQRLILERAGIWLSRFHRVAHLPEDPSLSGLQRYVSNREKGLAVLDTALGRLLQERLESGGQEVQVRIHGDFAPHNILYGRGRLGVIDYSGLAEFEIGPPAFDIAKMHVDLSVVWRQSWRNPRRAATGPPAILQQALIDGYGERFRADAMFDTCLAVVHFGYVYDRYMVTGRAPTRRNQHVAALSRLLST